ncbi:sulfotransferase domain-containing protein [Salipiger sp.]|uniref:sulfotransferase domain-containing protein n=1 Tax=Salipiger sp. TaxID=2078585 RepID=UPI003A9782FE
MTEHRIFHMASFSRSGETLLQRCLNAHPDIEVVHQIHEPDSKEDLALFRHLMTREEQTISGDDPLLAHRSLSPDAVILLKNAVWTHPAPRHGFTLIRNPFSIIVSAFRHTEDSRTSEHQRKQQMRWCTGIDPLMMPYVETAENLDGYLALYSRKMLQDYRDGLPFVRYEDFVQDPETWLKRIVAHMGLAWSDRVMNSHEDYRKGETGHGKIKLWQPIHAGSSDKYKVLTEAQRARVYALTGEALASYGYGWDGEDITLRDVPGLIGTN